VKGDESGVEMKGHH